MRRLSARNRFTNTAPCILHANAYAKTPAWRDIVEKWRTTATEPADETKDLSVFTWNTDEKKSLLEESFDRFGITYYKLGQGVRQWCRHQIFLTEPFLRMIETPYAMASDAYDAILIEPPRRALDIFKFKYGGKGILYSAETNYWPEEAGTKEYEENRHGGRFRYLNSGGFIGETEALREFFAAMLEEAKDLSKGFGNDEQGIAHRTAAKPEFRNVVRLDHDCAIFQPLFGMLPGELELHVVTEETPIRNFPQFIHNPDTGKNRALW